MAIWPARDEDDITQVVCTHCGHARGVGVASSRCAACDHPFSSTQRRANSRRLSSAHVGFGAHAAELADRLEARRGAAYLSLAAEGRRLESEFARWATAPPDDGERGASISGLAEWARQAMDLLTMKR